MNYNGYIYFRNHPYDLHGAYKMGKTHNIPERDSQRLVKLQEDILKQYLRSL